MTISPEAFAGAPSGARRAGDWGGFADAFLKLNQKALAALDVTPETAADASGFTLRLRPGGRTGAVPLRSGQTGHVAGGIVVQPRFGWAGVGRVLQETGWPAFPEFHQLPMVPGSGREVPPWVLAGPVLVRLEALLKQMRRGYQEREEMLAKPRGRILWHRYIDESLARGHWSSCPVASLICDTTRSSGISVALERYADLRRRTHGPCCRRPRAHCPTVDRAALWGDTLTPPDR